jgi:uncharacterized protein HemY
VSVKDIDQVWANWESIKKAEKAGSKHERKSALDGVPRHLPALMRSQKLLKKASKAGLASVPQKPKASDRKALATALFDLTAQCQAAGWSAEELLRAELRRRESDWRREERRQAARKTA